MFCYLRIYHTFKRSSKRIKVNCGSGTNPIHRNKESRTEDHPEARRSRSLQGHSDLQRPLDQDPNEEGQRPSQPPSIAVNFATKEEEEEDEEAYDISRNDPATFNRSSVPESPTGSTPGPSGHAHSPQAECRNDGLVAEALSEKRRRYSAVRCPTSIVKRVLRLPL